MSVERVKSMVRRVVEVQQNGNVDAIDQLFAEDFVDHTPFPGVTPDREGVKDFCTAMLAAFPDLRVTIQDQVAQEDAVATRKLFSGSHRGAFLGLPASGREMTFEVIDILRFRDGRITDHWLVVDSGALIRQLTVGAEIRNE